MPVPYVVIPAEQRRGLGMASGGAYTSGQVLDRIEPCSRRDATAQSPSSSGLGLRPFKAAARVRIPLGARGPDQAKRLAQVPIIEAIMALDPTSDPSSEEMSRRFPWLRPEGIPTTWRGPDRLRLRPRTSAQQNSVTGMLTLSWTPGFARTMPE